MLRNMCVDFSSNLMAISGCHSKRKNKRLYNLDKNDIYLKNFENTIVSPRKNEIISNSYSNTQLNNSNQCKQILNIIERERFLKSANDIQQELKERQQANDKKNKEFISIEGNTFIDERNCQNDSQNLEDLLIKPKHKKSEAYIYTQENNASTMPSKKKQFVELFCNIEEVKKKHKKLIKNKDNLFMESFRNMQKTKQNLEEFEIRKNVESDFGKKHSVEDDEPQFITESVNSEHQAKKKSTKEKNVDPNFAEKFSAIKDGRPEFIAESAFDEHQINKKHKSKKKKDTDHNFEKKNFAVEDDQCQFITELVIDKHQINKKHKKSKKKKNTEHNFVKKNSVEDDQCQFITESVFDEHQINKKCKKSKKKKDTKHNFKKKNSAVEDNQCQFITESVSDEHQTKKKHRKSKKDKDVEANFTEKDSAFVDNQPQFISQSIFKEKNKKDRDVEPFISEDNNGVNIQIKKASSESFPATLNGKNNCKDFYKNKTNALSSAVQNIALSEEIQSVDTLSCIKKKKHKQSKKNEDKVLKITDENNDEEITFLEERNIVTIGKQLRKPLNEENRYVGMVCDVQLRKKKHKKSRKNEIEVRNSTDEISVVKTANNQNNHIDSFCIAKELKIKHKKSKIKKDKEPTFMEGRNITETGHQSKILPFEKNESVDVFCDVQHLEKKHKKSKRNKNRVQNNTDENDGVNIANEENQSVDLFYDAKKIKHKKSKRNENIESTIIAERNEGGIGNHSMNLSIEGNQSVDIFCDVQCAKKKHKSKKNNSKGEKITDENNDVQIVNEQYHNVDLYCNEQQMKKKHKKSERNKNKESSIEMMSVNSNFGGSFNNLKQLKKNNKRSKSYDIEPALSVENYTDDFLNKEDEFQNSLSNMSKKKYRKCENNIRQEPVLCEMFDMSNIDKRSYDDRQKSFNNENNHPIAESLQEVTLNFDFYEEPVDFDVPPLHAFETIHSLTKEQKNEMLFQGVIIKSGRFTREEDKILLKNFESFAQKYGRFDVCDIFGIGTASRNPKIQQFLKAKHFYLRLGKGLPDRTLSCIYRRARLLLHPHKNNAKMSQIEVENVKQLRTVLNKKWTYIGENFEQPPDKCLQTFRWHGKSISKGKWTVEEENKLIEAMKTVTGNSDLSSDKVKGISWEKVATYVPSRNSTQCRMHWANHLCWKPGTKRTKWNESFYKELVEILRKDWYVESASGIDWFEIHKSFKNISPSPLHVQKRWLYLKSKIAGFKNKDYKTILNELCDLYNVSINKIYSVPFSSSAINQRISQSITNMQKFLENR